jgi:hypothetical protein
MNLEGVLYIEAPEQDEHVPCTGCALIDEPRLCAESGAKEVAAFGGGCGTRAVIYLRGDEIDGYKAAIDEAREAERAAVAECERLRADAGRWHDLLSRTVAELDDFPRIRRRTNAPGHGHSRPGVWDDDNGSKAGKPCAWCSLWNEARSALAARATALSGSATPSASVSSGQGSAQ